MPRRTTFLLETFLLMALSLLPATHSLGQDHAIVLKAHWDKTVSVSQTTATLQVVVNPPMRRGTPIHDNVFKTLRDLKADYVRYVPWLPYPRLGVAELEPPTAGKTSWDFSLIDPMTIDFIEATKGHSVILNFSTIPAWMFKTSKPVTYPSDPNQPVWDYTQGAEFRDPTMKEVGDYYGRLFSWYTQGGFTDEAGKRRESGFHYNIPYWEVLNEIEYEHQMSPELYTRVYDSVVTAIRRVAPQTKFVGLALATPSQSPEQFEYFLNPKNHQAGIPLDFISYHFYAVPTPDQNPDIQQYTFFAQADGFLNTVRYVESIRKRLSPTTKTTIDELGAIAADDLAQGDASHTAQTIPNSYWNLTCAMYAYLFGEMTRMGIDVVGESQLVGYPTQFPSVSMVDWNTGKPNARLWVLKLLRENFGPGDKIVETEPFDSAASNYLYSLVVVKPDGKRRALLVNKRDRPFDISVPGATGGREEYVDQTTAFDPPGSIKLTTDTVTVRGLSVAVVTLP
ncbi:MAG TPA: glycosyl hydrolase family 39 [Terriglobales bacterium]|nr:glycosyl hydrolase family 39 [Terriglobales bacterium]